jgi:hypothetical protein
MALDRSSLSPLMTRWHPHHMTDTLAQDQYFALITSDHLLFGSHYEGNQLQGIIHRIPLYSIMFCSMCTDESYLLHIDFFINEKDPCQVSYDSLYFIGYLSNTISCAADQKQVETYGQNALPVYNKNVSMVPQKYLYVCLFITIQIKDNVL